MTMKITQMVTHLEPDGALEVIMFIEQLRELLWLAYGEDIAHMQRDCTPYHTNDNSCQLDLNLGHRALF